MNMNTQPHMYYQQRQEQTSFVRPNHNYNQVDYMNKSQGFQNPNVNVNQYQQQIYGSNNPSNFVNNHNLYFPPQQQPSAVPNPNYVQHQQQHLLPQQINQNQSQQHNPHQHFQQQQQQQQQPNSVQNQATASNENGKTDDEKPKTLGVPAGKKGRSLAELMDKQIADGKIDPNEEIVDRNNRYVYKPNESGPWDQNQRYANDNPSSSRGGRRQYNNSQVTNGPSLEYEGDTSSLNWQQQQLLSNGNGHGGAGSGEGGRNSHSRNQRYGNGNNSERNYSAPSAFNSARRSGDGGSGGPGSYHSSGDYQQRRGGYNNYNRNSRQSNGNGYQQMNNYRNNNYQNEGRPNYRNNRNFEPPVKENDYDNNPEWADDIATSSSKEVNNTSLNWQQQSLVNRDESDPFNRLVRGENELFRE